MDIIMKAIGDEHIPSKGLYQGLFLNNKNTGNRTIVFETGTVYIGEWLNNKYHGFGVLIKGNKEKYEGYLRKNLKHGKRKHISITGMILEGV